MAKARKTPAKHERGSSSFFSSLTPTKQDLLCIAFLYLITLVLFRGIVFENAAFSEGGDTAASLSYAHAGDEIMKTEGVDALWMPYFFSGMPTFGSVSYTPHDVNYMQFVLVNILKVLYLNSTWGWLPVFYLLAGVFMFFLLRVWNFSRITALLGAITFMLSPNAIGLAGEGHGSKLMALSYLPLVFLLTHLLFERRDILSFGLLSAAIGTLMLTNHMQIVYYVFMVLGMFLLYHIITDFKQNKFLAARKIALFAGALFVGLCISSYIYLSVYEYSTFSIRGGGTAGSTGGLAYDYATNWSWNPWETMVFIIPSFFGFSSQHPMTWQGQANYPLPLYWGSMPFHTSSEYMGIVPILLALVALVYKRTRMTIFFASITIFFFFISFGKHLSFVYDALFHYLPFFNKFRIPSMILQLIPFTTAVIGAYGMSFLLGDVDRMDQSKKEQFRRVLQYAIGIVGAILVVFVLFKSSVYSTLSGSWFAKPDENYGQQTQEIVAALKPLRFEVMWKDYIKFAFLFAAAAGAMIGLLRKKISGETLGIILITILLVDLIIIDVKFINPKPARKLEESFQPDATVSFLKQQPGLFRVFPVGDLFMDNSFAYHGITSVGGYSPAKLKIYQTMLDSCMYKSPDPGFPINMNIVNMLNVKYLVLEGQLPEGRFQLVNTDPARKRFTYQNPSVLPRAFFVNDVRIARTQTDVFTALNSGQFNSGSMAVVEEPLPGEISKPDSSSAEITAYQSRSISIKAYASSPAPLVLSEVYYPAGWKAYVDGVETKIYKTNYILRSIVVPQGNHELAFRFEPVMYTLGLNLTRVAWGITFLCILLGLWKTPAIRARFLKKDPEQAGLARG